MNNVFAMIIDKESKHYLGTITFIPRKNDRISINGIETEVECVLYESSEHSTTLVFVNIVEPYYTKMINEIKW